MTLQSGDSPSVRIPAMIISDNKFEEQVETYEVRVEILPDQPLSSRIFLATVREEVNIRDDESWFG